MPPVGPDAASRLADALAGEASPTMQATASVAEATRQLIQVLMATDAPADDLDRAAGLVAQAASLLSGVPSRRPYEGFAESSMAGEERTFLQFSPLVGPANPLAPPITLGVADDHVVGHVVFGDAYEGPPGCVHGGFVAAAFDEVLGFTMSFTGLIGMTGLLTVRYRKPTPLHRELRFHGQVDRVDGRKLYTSATLHDGDTLTAEAEALFVSVDPEVFVGLMQARSERSG
jgi:acyl-coenzyme A thioesterase PaaI-like protein